MNIIKVTEEYRDFLGEFIFNKKAEYFSHIREFQNNYSNSQFWLAMDDNEIQGTMFYNKAGTVKMRGSNVIIDAFFKQLKSTPKYIDIPTSALEIAQKYIKSEKKRLNMIRLIMDKTDFTFDEIPEILVLEKQDLKRALVVFQAAEPDDWQDMDVDKLPFDNKNQWYAIESNDQLVSVCWNQIYNHAGHIAFIATHPDHQRKGYASALIKYTLNETFKQTDFAVIHVMKENVVAVNTYRKLGYLDHVNYIVFCEPELQKLL